MNKICEQKPTFAVMQANRIRGFRDRFLGLLDELGRSRKPKQ